MKIFTLCFSLLLLSSATSHAQNFKEIAKKTLENSINVESFGDDIRGYKFLFGVESSKKGHVYIVLNSEYKNDEGQVESEEIQVIEVDNEAKTKAKLAFVDMTIAGFEDMTFVKISKEDRIKIEAAYIVHMKEEFRQKGKSFVEYAKEMLKKKDLSDQDRKFFNKVTL
ncbi:hypothetical protein GW915_07055 [bacterium]|nr:hypothetical protein [bacterium]